MYLISDHRQWLSYRGLSPHKFMPMLGIHKHVIADAYFIHDAHYICAGYAWRWAEQNEGALTLVGK